MKRLHPMRPNAFTLVEISVSTAVALLLLISLSTTALNVAQQGRRLSDHLDRGSRVRLMTALLVSDLQSAIIRQDGNTWLAIDILDTTDNSGSWVSASGQKPADDSLQLDPREKDRHGREWAKPEDYRFGVGGMWLRFITAAADRDVFSDGQVVPGDVNAVSYQLIRHAMPTAGVIHDEANASYQLFRSLVRSDHTFATGYTVDAYDSGDTQPGSPGEMKAPSADSMLCDNIIDFGVIVHEWNEEGKVVQGFPMRHESLPPLKKKKQLPCATGRHPGHGGGARAGAQRQRRTGAPRPGAAGHLRGALVGNRASSQPGLQSQHLDAARFVTLEAHDP